LTSSRIPDTTLPQSAIEATKRIILDSIAVTIAAFDTPMATALLKLKRDQGGRPDATLAVDGTKVPAQSAAYVHAQLSNLLDADDTFLNRAHFASANVMSALAVGEMTGANGRDVIAAVAAGFDITTRIGCALEQFTTDDAGEVVLTQLFGWSWMSLGAAAAAAKLLGLDGDRLAHTLGQAFVTTPIVFDVLGAMRPSYEPGQVPNWHKYQLCGPYAEAGINAALLAAEGWVAQPDVFDEGSEFWRSFGAVGCNWDLMYNDLGSRWFIEETSIKPYPSCRSGHPALDLLSGIVREHDLSPDDIDCITLRMPPFAHVQALGENVAVDHPLKLMANLSMVCALVAAGVPAGPRWWHADLSDPGLRSLAGRVKFELNHEWGSIMAEQLQAAGGGWVRKIPTEVIVRAGPTEYTGYDEYAVGDQFEPSHAMSDADVADKVRRFTEGLLSPAKTEALIDAVLGLENAADLCAVAAAMSR
jgi:2-methylcitrate dehydratase PrpD